MLARVRLPFSFACVAAVWALLSVRAEPVSPREPKITWIYDFYHLFRPNAEYLAERLARGDLPLWDPRHAFGEPFLAATQPGVLYPFNALHVVLPSQIAFVVLAVLHIAVAGFFATLLARRLGAGTLGALLAGTLYAGSHHLFLLAWNAHHLFTAALLPAVWWAVDRCIARPSLASTTALALCFALQILAGWPQTCVLTAAFAGGYGIVFLLVRWRSERRPPLGAIGCLAGGVLLALALSSPQWLPTAEMVSHSTRAVGTLPGGHAAGSSGLYEPGPFFKSMIVKARNDGVPSTPSLVLVALALFASAARVRLFTVLLLGLAALGISFPHALPLHGWIDAVPGLGDFRFPFRYRLVTVLALALLAGVGATELARRLAGRRRAGAILFAVVALSLLPLLRPRQPIIQIPLHAEGPAKFSDEYAAAAGEQPPRLGRIYWADRYERLAGDQDASVLFDFEPLFLARPAELLTWFETGRVSVFQPVRGAVAPEHGILARAMLHPYTGLIGLPQDGLRAKLLDVMGASRIVAPDPPPWLARRFSRIGRGAGPAVFVNPDALPRAYRVAHAEPAPARPNAAFARLVSPSFDLRRSVLLDRVPEGLAAAPAAGPLPDAVAIERYEPEQVILRSRGEAPGVVILGDAHYPGWQATVNGRPAPILRANAVFRGVAVPAGESLVEFRFRPGSLRLGLGLAGAGALVLVALWALPGPWRR